MLARDTKPRAVCFVFEFECVRGGAKSAGCRMLGSDSTPSQPPRRRSIRHLMDEGTEEAGRGLEGKHSETDESLFGSFVKSRRDAAAEFTESSAKQKRSNSPPVEKRHGSISPLNEPEPAKSPRDQIQSKSPLSKSSKHRSPLPKSSKHRSPRPRVSPRASASPHASKSPRDSKIKSKALRAKVKDSFPDLGKTLKENKSLEPEDDGTQSLPSLVDDSVIRETVAGFRGGKEWNIMEDTPGGHVPEDFHIVPGIEFLDEDDTVSWRPRAEEPLAEDDDIDDDPIEYEIDSQRNARKQMLSNEPVNGGCGVHKLPPGNAGDRFNPSFKNHDIWTSDDEPDDKKSESLCPTGDGSILSDGDLETVSELASFNLTDDQDMSEHDEIDDINDSSKNLSKTPATAKRSGGRPRSGNTKPFPYLDDCADLDIEEDDDIKDEVEVYHQHPASVPENSPLDSKRKSRRKKKKTSSSTSSSNRRHSSSAYQRGKGHNNSKSTKRRSGNVGPRRQSETEDIGTRGPDASRKIPDVIPATPSQGGHSYVRSPMSSSLTSTPTSWVSSTQQQLQQMITLQKIAAQTQTSPKRRKNKSLQLHVNQEAFISNGGDDNTLGASTITTNLSSTQRTRGENTVNTASTRSLFQTKPMCGSERLRLPMRSRADSDSDYSDVKPTSGRAKVESESIDDKIPSTTPAECSLFESDEKVTTLDNPFPLRRPSGEGDDLLGIVNTTHSKSSSDSVSEGSEFMRWLENGKDLISPKATVKGIREHGAFLQLEPDDGGLLVDSKISTVPDLDSPLETQHGPDSPATTASPFTKNRTRKSRLGLFRRVQSWKGVIALSDGEE